MKKQPTLMEWTKAVLIGNFMEINYLERKERGQINNLTLYLMN